MANTTPLLPEPKEYRSRWGASRYYAVYRVLTRMQAFTRTERFASRQMIRKWIREVERELSKLDREDHR